MFFYNYFIDMFFTQNKGIWNQRAIMFKFLIEVKMYYLLK